MQRPMVATAADILPPPPISSRMESVQ